MTSSQVKQYYQLTKPGIIYGNLISAAAGFLLGSRWHVHPILLLATLLAIACIIASACVFNNYIDRNIDAKMPRTKNRALVTKTVSVRSALMFATLLGIVGFIVLILFTNPLTVLMGIIAYVDYIVFYAIGKRKSVYGTIIGSIAGAMPLVAGYTSATNTFGIGGLLLFAILVIWQMPHFYAIAIYRLKDYENAMLPVLPVEKGIATTKIQIVSYVGVFIIATLLLTFFKFTGILYFIVMTISGFSWLLFGISGFFATDNKQWARKMFFASLLVLLLFSLMISINVV